MYSVICLFLLLLGGFPLEDSKTLSGRVTDSETSEPISFAYIHVEEINRTTTSDIDGYFELSNLPFGEYHISIHRIGYKSKHFSVNINDESEEAFDITLISTLLTSQSIEVTAAGIANASNLPHASQKIFGDDLRQELGATLSQTLSNLPGFSQRTWGTAPGRPVIRGLGDERISILEDGISSGDVSDNSGDHPVSLESSSALEIEIARGPAALAYGANAVGGIINVVSNKISSTIPSRTNGTYSLSGETVNTGGATSLNVSVPLSSFVVNLNVNGRTALDTDTPLGKIENTYINTFSSSFGASYVKDWGFLGSSFTYYSSEFGIAPDPLGHPNGVDLDVEKFQYVLKSEYIIKNSPFNIWETDFSINNYNHVEIESNGSIGTEFGLVTTSLISRVFHSEIGFFEKGNLGFSYESKDYAVFGAGTPNSNSYSFGAFIVEEKDFDKFHIEAGLRYDYVLAKPEENDPTSNIGNIRSRTFSALSSSFSSSVSLSRNLSLGAILLHSFRAPSLEELYSEGPHLATFNFEIGNPEAKSERGLAKELFLSYNTQKSLIRASVYHNGFSNYLFLQNTGRRNNRFPDLNDYQTVGTSAQLYGFELSLEQELLKNILFKSSLSYTVGRRDSSDTNSTQVPLPQIPPFKFKTSAKYSLNDFHLGARFTYSSAQNDLGEFETPTDSYVLVGAFASYELQGNGVLHTFSLNASNLFNETYRDHLSLIKDLNPEPGRNFSLLYRLYF